MTEARDQTEGLVSDFNEVRAEFLRQNLMLRHYENMELSGQIVNQEVRGQNERARFPNAAPVLESWTSMRFTCDTAHDLQELYNTGAAQADFTAHASSMR